MHVFLWLWTTPSLQLYIPYRNDLLISILGLTRDFLVSMWYPVWERLTLPVTEKIMVKTPLKTIKYVYFTSYTLLLGTYYIYISYIISYAYFLLLNSLLIYFKWSYNYSVK